MCLRSDPQTHFLRSRIKNRKGETGSSLEGGSPGSTMETNKEADNRRALSAAHNDAEKEIFLREHQKDILHLTGKIAHRFITESDDEWAVAFYAVSQAIDSYDESRGDFWAYASVVIRSRLTDWYRKNETSSAEFSVSPEAFSGEIEDDAPDMSLRMAVRDRTTQERDTSLQEEILALNEELQDYGISFFDLADCSPRTAKTRSACASVIRAIFLPPPLMALIRSKKMLPVREILDRVRVPRKQIDRHRRYLVAASLILDGDYPGIAEYVSYLRNDDGREAFPG